MSAIPHSIRKFLDSGRGEIRQLEHEYHIWLLTTVLAFCSSMLLIGVSIALFALNTSDSLIVVRLAIGVTVIINIFVTYVTFQETLTRRRYLFEIQKLMLNGLSFLDSIRRGFKDMFGG